MALESQKYAAIRILNKLNKYVSFRVNNVERGLETPELAGLLVNKYGYGLCDSFNEIFGPGDPCLTYNDVDNAVELIDPNWEATQKSRWEAVAGLDLGAPRAEDSSLPYFLGIEACKNHEGKKSNPYHSDDWRHNDWERGRKKECAAHETLE